MSANIDTMIHVNELPWHGLSIDVTDNPPKSGAEIIHAGQMDWTVGAIPMITGIHERVENYHCIYREDNMAVLGAVNRRDIIPVQNVDMFSAVDHLIGESLDVETVASLGKGEQVFGCFKIRNQYKVLDDDVDHYFVILNEHLKPDGKVTILNTPVRVVCQNTLSYALSNSLYKLRVPISDVRSINETIASKLFVSVDNALTSLQKRADAMYGKKITKEYVNTLLDELFPYHNPDNPESMFSKQNEAISQMRSMFLTECMGADNLANFRGTQWQVLNAVIDWDEHMFKSMNKAYDLNYRMKLLPGIGENTSKTATFLKIADKIAA